MCRGLLGDNVDVKNKNYSYRPVKQEKSNQELSQWWICVCHDKMLGFFKGKLDQKATLQTRR